LKPFDFRLVCNNEGNALGKRVPGRPEALKGRDIARVDA
jgi:hypothetical protein